ncbi:MAG: alpha/beta hydrolase [Pseudomonadota bacterium]
MADYRTETFKVLNGHLDMAVNIAGSGEPIVYLHSAGGFYWDDFLQGLSEKYTVYAPHFPGTAPGDPDAISKLEHIWDAVIAYEDLLDAIGLEQVTLMGHSFGGLLAAEVAAQCRDRIKKLVLIAPAGLYREDTPYTCADWCSLDFDEIMEVLFYDKEHPRVARRMARPEGEAGDLWDLEFIWTLGCTGKLIWPIPDKGLRKRIHRVTAPVLVVWGENDKLIPPVYAEEFSNKLPNAEVALFPKCGHEPPLEACEELTEKVESFLAA